MPRHAGDCHEAINTQFGEGKLVGLAVSRDENGTAYVSRIDWAPGTSDKEKEQIQAFCDSYDFSLDGVQDQKPGEFEASVRKAIASGEVDPSVIPFVAQLAQERDPAVRAGMWDNIKKANIKGLDTSIDVIEESAASAKMHLK